MVNGKFLGGEGAAAYREWIRTAIAENRPYDQFVHELFTSTGSNREHPGGVVLQGAAHARHDRRDDARRCSSACGSTATSATTIRSSGGRRTTTTAGRRSSPTCGCRRTPRAATARSPARRSRRPSRCTRSSTTAARRAMLHLRTGKPAAARFPFADGDRRRDTPAELRQQAAAWLTSADNRYFASSYVNRVWAQLTGAGLIEPIDDIRAGNPPTNPELLEWLTDEFVASEFDVAAADPHDLPVADLPAFAGDEPVERRRPPELLARPAAAAAGRGAVRRGASGRRLDVATAGRAAGDAGGGAAGFDDRGRERAAVEARPAGPRERLRMRADERPAAWAR